MPRSGGDPGLVPRRDGVVVPRGRLRRAQQLTDSDSAGWRSVRSRGSPPGTTTGFKERDHVLRSARRLLTKSSVNVSPAPRPGVLEALSCQSGCGFRLAIFGQPSLPIRAAPLPTPILDPSRIIAAAWHAHTSWAGSTNPGQGEDFRSARAIHFVLLRSGSSRPPSDWIGRTEYRRHSAG